MLRVRSFPSKYPKPPVKVLHLYSRLLAGRWINSPKAGTYGVRGSGVMLTSLISKMSPSVGPQYLKWFCPGTGSGSGLPVSGSARGDWPQNGPRVAAKAVEDRAMRRTVKHFIVVLGRCVGEFRL